MKERAGGREIWAALIARDVSDNADRRVLPLLAALEIPVLRCGTRASLGAAVGRGPVAVIGIMDRALAERAVRLLRGEVASTGGSPPQNAQEDVR